MDGPPSGMGELHFRMEMQQRLPATANTTLRVDDGSGGSSSSINGVDVTTNTDTTRGPRTKIAYAVTVTGFNRTGGGSSVLLDRAAVLHHSIKLAMRKSHRYDYDMYAFVHPDATDCASLLTQLGYTVQIRDTPFNISDVRNEQLVDAQKVGCCGEKEYLKLYSYLLSDYPVVVHLDLDAIVLRPMDDVFDLMIDPTYNRSNFNSSTMWTDMELYDGKVDFIFTRDYNMVRIAVKERVIACPWNEQD
jgi:hypothetical protein